MTTTRLQEKLQERRQEERQLKRQKESNIEYAHINKKQKLETIIEVPEINKVLETIIEVPETIIEVPEINKVHERNTVEVYTNTDKQLKDYKIFVFDLDNTLYLHNVDQITAEKYHKKVNNFLMYLKDSDKLLYIATHNFNPDNYLNRINISPLLFNGIIKETKDVHPYINNISEYTSKKDMILEILDKHKDLKKDDVIFFDDHEYNIKEVEKLNVKSIYVNDRNGINFSEIY